MAAERRSRFPSVPRSKHGVTPTPRAGPRSRDSLPHVIAAAISKSNVLAGLRPQILGGRRSGPRDWPCVTGGGCRG